MMHTGWVKLLYLVLLIASALFSVLYLGPFSVLLLCILLVIPCIMALSVLYIRLNLKVSLRLTGGTYHRNTPQAVQLIAENRGFLPVGRAVASVLCTSCMSGVGIPVQLNFPIPARNVTTVEFTMTAAHCGKTVLHLQWLRFTDYIHLFGWKMRQHPQVSALILPMGIDFQETISISGSETDEESNLYSKLKPGDDPSEVYRIRAYQPGDMQKRIHWKLSCRTDTVWVKEYSFPIQQRAAILVDYLSMQEQTLYRMDTAFETAYALASGFVRQEIPVRIYWYGAEAGTLLWNELNSPKELNDCFTAMLSEEPPSDSSHLLTQVSEEASLRRTNAIYCCTPHYSEDLIQTLSGLFEQNRLYVLTAEKPPEESMDDSVHLLFTEQADITKTLHKLSDIEEVNG